MPNLIQNLTTNFSTFLNTRQYANGTKGSQEVLRILTTAESNSNKVVDDINNSLIKAINDHIATPLANASFVTTNFGNTWKDAYTLDNQPTEVLESHADWIGQKIAPILADAIAQKVTLLAPLVLGSAPPVAIAASSVVASALSLMPGGAPIASSMLSAVAAAQASVPPTLPAIPGIVAGAVSAMAGIISANRTTPNIAADFAKTLHFDLQSVGVAGAGETPELAWFTINPSILSIPINTNLNGEEGSNFWNTLLITIQQAIPGVRVT